MTLDKGSIMSQNWGVHLRRMELGQKSFRLPSESRVHQTERSGAVAVLNVRAAALRHFRTPETHGKRYGLYIHPKNEPQSLGDPGSTLPAEALAGAAFPLKRKGFHTGACGFLTGRPLLQWVMNTSPSTAPRKMACEPMCSWAGLVFWAH